MNDRFRFRAWDKQDKELIYEAENTYDCQSYNGHTIWHDNFACLLDDEERYTVEQCTGLKDKNGRFIYEGDIVKVAQISANLPVVYDQKFAMFELISNIYLISLHGSDDIFEVIGNIHENPELFEDNNGR